MFDSIDLKKELIKVRSNSENDFVNSVNQLLDSEVIKETEIEKIYQNLILVTILLMLLPILKRIYSTLNPLKKLQFNIV